MRNTMEYESQLFVGNTIVQNRIFEATGIEEAKAETRKWIAEIVLPRHPTQVALLLGGKVAWASRLPEAV